MATHNPKAKKLIDNYITKAPDFAKPICKKLRQIIFKAEPNIIEDWKWGPNYLKNGMVCNFGYSKHHVHFGFFRGASLKDPKNLLAEGKDNLNSRYMKLTSIDDIDEKVFIAYIKEAVRNNEKGIVVKDRTVILPPDFRKALYTKKLIDKYEHMNYTCRKEYVQWIGSAKKQETRASRIQRAVEMISRGKKFS
jgi:hypothetical protein